MRKTVLSIYEEIQGRIWEYLDTAFLTNSAEFNEARRNLVLDEEAGPVFRHPNIEVLPRYVVDTINTNDLLTLSGLFTSIDKSCQQDLENFLSVFDPIKFNSLYKHQVTSIENACRLQKDFVVTTGTGSGKSYCFMIPLILNILSESLGQNGRQKWNGPTVREDAKWWGSQKGRFVAKRNSSRKEAVRALIMYPLNALVQDQVDELRSIVDGGEATAFYNKYLNGDRIFFGQYSGSTPGSGTPEGFALNDCRKDLQAIDRRESKVIGESGGKVQSTLGSELITRWDMQKTPPDILITNYSMLSTILIRDAEQTIFDSTKEWLAESEYNVFYLVLDELHSYRGYRGY